MTPAESGEADLHRVESAITGLASAFATDGYIMSVTGFDGAILRMAIAANEGACAECLVPHDMMVGLVRATLPSDLADAKIEIAYPVK